METSEKNAIKQKLIKKFPWIVVETKGYDRIFPNKLFVFMSHEKNREPSGAITQQIHYDADVRIRVEGYKAFVISRFGNPEKEGGRQNFIIWKKGANEYWLDKI